MKKYVIVDLEWTSWKEDYNKKKQLFNKRKTWQKREIIQIGAIKFDKNYKIVDKLDLYVKPKFNPILSDYIKNLTGIYQEKLKKIKESPKPRHPLLRRLKSLRAPFACWTKKMSI